jgi:hypothetical protein
VRGPVGVDMPVNGIDPAGLCDWYNPVCGVTTVLKTAGNLASSATDVAVHLGKEALHAGLDAVTVIPYAVYYGNYELGSAINSLGDRFGAPGHYLSRGINLFLTVPGQAAGLAGDAVIDFVKGHTVADESVCDEGHQGYINPFHDYVPGPFKGPQVYLPGIHADGSIDFAW